MSADTRRRAAERAAQRDPNDLEAVERAAAEATRCGHLMFGRLVGKWILGMGVRSHYVGKVVSTADAPAGSVLWCYPCYELDNFEEAGPTGATIPLTPPTSVATEEVPYAVLVAHLSSVGPCPWGDKSGL